MLLKLVSLFIVAIFLYLFITQITIPAIKNTPLFPMFRRSYRKANEKLSDALGEQDIAELNEQITHTRISTAKIDLRSTLRTQSLDDDFKEVVDYEEENKKERVRI